MASFISALSLLILVLANGCFTLPVVDEQFWSSTLSSLNDDLTTEKVLNLALVSDDETTGLPSMEPKRPTYEHMEFGMSSSTDSLLTENTSPVSRVFDEFTTSESLTDKRDHDELLLTTVESITQDLDHALRGLKRGSELETGKDDYHQSWSTTVEPNGQSRKRESETLTINSEDKNVKIDMPIELTTSFMPSFTSTSSAVAPELYTSESSTTTSTPSTTSTSTLSTTLISTSSSTSTEQYTGHLPHEVEEGEEQQHHEKVEEKEKEKPWKTQTKPKVTTIKKLKTQTEDEPEKDFKESKFKITTTRKSKLQSEEYFEESQSKLGTTRKSKVEILDKPTEDSKELSFPTAVFDQDASNKVSNVPNDFLILEENDSPIVTDRPDKFSTVTMDYQTKPKLLNQGKKSSQPEEKESNH